MNNNLLSWLIDTGLDEQRAKLYLACLSKSEARASDLAAELKIGRTAVYDNLRFLVDKGYIKVINEGKRQLFIPLHPKELYKKISQQKEQLKDLLPDFMALYADEASQPFVQLYTGKYASREVYEDILKVTQKEYVYFVNPAETYKALDKTYIKHWVRRRVDKKISCRRLQVQQAAGQTVLDPIFTKEQDYLRQIRYLPMYVDLKSTIYIYENKIGIISSAGEESAVIISSPSLAYSLKKLFEFMWSIGGKSQL